VNTSSTRRRILEGFKARLEAILRDGGYRTDAGTNVLLGELPLMGDDDPEVAIVVIPGEETPLYVQVNITATLPVRVLVLAKAVLDEPWVAVEDVLADVITAIEQPDRTLGGLLTDPKQLVPGAVRPLPREVGSLDVGVVVEYRVSYTRGWGAP